MMYLLPPSDINSDFFLPPMCLKKFILGDTNLSQPSENLKVLLFGPKKEVSDV